MKRKLLTVILTSWALVFGPFLPALSAQWMTVLAGSTPAGPNTWYITASTTHNASQDATSTFVRRAPVVVGQAGTATKLKVYITNYTSSVNVAMGLYDGNTLLAQITPVASSANGYLEGTLTSTVAVTAKTYYVGNISSSSTSNTQFAGDSGTTTGDGQSGQTYPTFPSTFAANFTSQLQLDCGIFVQ